MEQELVDQLDGYVREGGFANRSQAISFLIGRYVTELKWQCNNVVAGALIVMYESDKKEITSRIAAITALYSDVILSCSQYFIDHGNLMQVISVRGEARRLTELSDRLTTIKGIKHGKLVMSRAS